MSGDKILGNHFKSHASRPDICTSVPTFEKMFQNAYVYHMQRYAN